MDTIILIKRRLPDSPNTFIPILTGGELAFDEKTDQLYIGTEVAGTIAIGGPGAFVTLRTQQTIIGNKSFTGNTTLANTSFSPFSTVNLAGSRLQNLGDPVVLTDAANKAYIDSVAASKLSISGGTLTGGLLGTTATFSTSISAPALFGDGSRLTGIITGTANALALSGGTLTGGLSAPSLSGTFFGDGSRLIGVNSSNKLPLSGGTLTGNLYGTRGIFNTSVTAPSMSSVFYGTFIGNGAFLTNIVGTSGNSGGADPTKLSLLGGTLLGDLYGTNATFSSSISAPVVSGAFYGDGSNLTGLPATYVPPADATFTSSVSAPALSGTFFGDGSRLTGIVSPVGIYVPLSGGVIEGNLTIRGSLSAANTENWQTTYSLVQANSASWNNLAGTDTLSSYNFYGDGVTTVFDLSSSTPQVNAAGYVVVLNGATQTPYKDYTIFYAGSANKLATSFIPPLGCELSVVYLGNRINSVTTIISEGGGGINSDVGMLSANWQNTYTNVLANSAAWNIVKDIPSLSGNWQDTYTNVQSNSAIWNLILDVSSLSANWQDTYTNVLANSAAWNLILDVSSLSANWQDTYTTVLESSANWQSSYTNVQANSALWSLILNVASLSSYWEDTYTNVLANSGSWNDKLPLAGGTITGNLLVTGALSALNGSTFINTVFANTSALEINNAGLGPALRVTQGAGDGDIASFYDGDGVEVLHIGNALNPISEGVIGIKTSYPNKTLTVAGEISALGEVWASKYYGDGSSLTGVTTDITKLLPLSGGTLTGNLTGTTAVFIGSVSAVELYGKHYGDGSSLTGISTDITKLLPLSGGTLTGNLTGTNAVFTTSVSAVKYHGDGSSLTDVRDSTKLALSGGTLTGGLTGTTATFTDSISASVYYGDGSNLTNINATLNFASQTQVQYLESAVVKVYQYYNSSTDSLDTVFN